MLKLKKKIRRQKVKGRGEIIHALAIVFYTGFTVSCAVGFFLFFLIYLADVPQLIIKTTRVCISFLSCRVQNDAAPHSSYPADAGLSFLRANVYTADELRQYDVSACILYRHITA